MTNPRPSIDEIRAMLTGSIKPRKEEEIAKASVDDDGKVSIYNSTLEKLGAAVAEEAKNELKPAIIETIAKSTASEVGSLETKLVKKYEKTHEDLLKLAESTRVIEVKANKKSKKMDGVMHRNFENLLKTVNAGLPVLMVGPAGTGKTHSAALVAEALSLDFFSISVGSQTSKSDLAGYMSATGNYVETAFRRAYEDGGVFLLDEADAGNSNVLILLNAALSNGYMAFPDKMVKAHDDFRLIATANTFGTGASRQYVGRNQLDAATIDRFTTIIWDIDDRIEEAMAGDTAEGKKWLNVVRVVRNRALNELDLRVVISPRATQRGVALLTAGVPFSDVLEMALIANIPSEQASIRSLAETAWNK